MDEREAKELLERVRRLERELGALQGWQGYDRQPGLNVLGQSSKVNGNLEVTGALTVGSTLTLSGVYSTWTPTFTGFSANPGSVSASYIKIGRLCWAYVVLGLPGTSNSTSFTISAPFKAYQSGAGSYGSLAYAGYDNGVAMTTPPLVTITAGATVFTLWKTVAGGAGSAWTAANDKSASFGISYMTDS